MESYISDRLCFILIWKVELVELHNALQPGVLLSHTNSTNELCLFISIIIFCHHHDSALCTINRLYQGRIKGIWDSHYMHHHHHHHNDHYYANIECDWQCCRHVLLWEFDATVNLPSSCISPLPPIIAVYIILPPLIIATYVISSPSSSTYHSSSNLSALRILNSSNS